MTQNPIFFKWWIQFVVIAFTSILISHLGWWTALWEADQTKLSFLILLIFSLASLTCGYISKKNTSSVLDRYQNYIWFASEAMITIGMIGTVAGFLLMLGTAFQDLDTTNIQNLQAVISDMAVGMSTALSTTLVGLVCSVLLKFQMVIIVNSWENDDAEVQQQPEV